VRGALNFREKRLKEGRLCRLGAVFFELLPFIAVVGILVEMSTGDFFFIFYENIVYIVI